jgi:hypothetical protein
MLEQQRLDEVERIGPEREHHTAVYLSINCAG